MVGLVAIANAAQDVDGVFDGRLFDVDRRKAALQRRVFFDEAAIFVQRGRADAAQLAARQRGLEHVACIHRAGCRACADHSVQLVDEEDDLAVGVLHFFQRVLEAFLELAAEARPGDHRAQIQRYHALAHQRLGHVVVGNLLRQSFDDGGLANAGLADQHGVVLCPPGQYLNHPQDLSVAADDRVEFALARHLRQVAAVTLQRAVLGFRGRIGDPLAAADLFHRVLDALFGYALVAQHIGRRAVALGGDAQKQVLGGDVFVFELAGFLAGDVDDPLQPRCDKHLSYLPAVVSTSLGALLQVLFDLAADHRGGCVHLFDDLCDEAIGLLQHGQKEVFGVHLTVLVALQYLICPHRGILCSFCKPIKSHHFGLSLVQCFRRVTTRRCMILPSYSTFFGGCGYDIRAD